MSDYQIGYMIGSIILTSLTYAIFLSIAAYLINLTNKRRSYTYRLKIRYAFMLTFLIVVLVGLCTPQSILFPVYTLFAGLSLIILIASFAYFLLFFLFKKSMNNTKRDQ